MTRRLARPMLEDMPAYAADLLGERSAEDLAAHRMRFLAVTRAAAIVGEAAARVPTAVQDRLVEIEFANAIAMRHRLVHVYGSIDPTILADTIRTAFPPLIAALNAALAGDLPEEHA